MYGNTKGEFVILRSDFRLFSRIMLDIPLLTDGAVVAVRMYCEDLVSARTHDSRKPRNVFGPVSVVRVKS